MAPGSAKDRDGHTTEPVLGRGDYEAAHQKPSAAAAANAPSRPPPPPRVAKSLPREQPGGRGSGRGAEGSASASPVAVGDREGKKTSTATQGGGHASSSPRRLGEKLARDHPGGGGRGAEGLASAAFPVVDRKGKRKVCAASEGAASSSSPPFERLSGEELGAGRERSPRVAKICSSQQFTPSRGNFSLLAFLGWGGGLMMICLILDSCAFHVCCNVKLGYWIS